MAITNRFQDLYETCRQEWDGMKCPHGVDHAVKQLVCSICLEYSMQGDGGEA